MYNKFILLVYQINQATNQNFVENNKDEIIDIKKCDNKDEENASEDSLETKKKIVETITESVVKDSKLCSYITPYNKNMARNIYI